jgi:hypothetical protein
MSISGSTITSFNLAPSQTIQLATVDNFLISPSETILDNDSTQ